MFSYIFFFGSIDKDETSYLFNLNSFYHISSSQYFEIEAPNNHTQDSRFPYLIRRTPLLVRKFKGLLLKSILA